MLASLETGATDTEYLELASKGRKADWSEVAHDDISCILQRLLDVVPRGVCTGPSGLDSRGSQEAAVQVNIIGTSPKQPPGGACSICGGPPSLDSVLIYTQKEIGRICDALVEPLANAIHSLDIHSLDDVDSLLSRASSVADAEVSLGTLLRDICSKVVCFRIQFQTKSDSRFT